jgi:hypothetical protein
LLADAGVYRWVELLSVAGTKRAIVDRAANLKQEQYESGTVFSKLFGHKSITDASATGTDAEER